MLRRTKVLRRGPARTLTLVSFARLRANAGFGTDRTAR
jgi:hypothetical protein